ncbi:VOC family protein [Streptomyces sp. NPDC059467]|uniref:VOC family protein n=1 Tax=Streptomyces sp. NPDC059467 TaxID=3346844 RepID=UPI0036BE04AA
MIDHVYITVSDLGRASAFYLAALKPLGWREIGFYESDTPGVPNLFGLCDRVYGSGEAVGASIWLRERQPGETGLYLGLAADSPDEVDATHFAALAAGGQDDGGAGPRPHFGPGYYAANVIDLDGNRLEIVNKAVNPKRPG